METQQQEHNKYSPEGVFVHESPRDQCQCFCGGDVGSDTGISMHTYVEEGSLCFFLMLNATVLSDESFRQ